MQKVNQHPVEKFFISPVNVRPTLANIKEIYSVHSAIARDYLGYTKLLIVTDNPNQTLAKIILAIDTSIYRIVKTTTNSQKGTITILLKEKKELLN